MDILQIISGVDRQPKNGMLFFFELDIIPKSQVRPMQCKLANHDVRLYLCPLEVPTLYVLPNPSWK